MRTSQRTLLLAIAPAALAACGFEEGKGGAGIAGQTSFDLSAASVSMICDFTNGDDSINDPRVGYWYAVSDGTPGGTQQPPENGDFVPETSCGLSNADGNPVPGCAHTTGHGWADWGAGLAFDFNSPGDIALAYDASAYTGIVFAARGRPPFKLAVPTVATSAKESGGTCVPTAYAATSDCEDHFGVMINVQPQWLYFVVPFAALSQEGFGQRVSFDPKTSLGLQFTADPNLDFDFYITNVAFY